MPEILAPFSVSQIAFIALASFGLATSIVIEHSQLLAKYYGVLRSRVAGGYNAAMKIMVVNRFGAALYLLLVSVSIDLGMTAEVIALFFAGAIFAIMVFDGAVTIFLLRQSKTTLTAVRRADLAVSPVIMSMIATLFGILGLTLPMLLSAANPALRLTMANTGFVLNSVFTILVVFFVESYLAKLIDDPKQHHRMAHFVIAVFIMRFFGTLVALLLMIAVSGSATMLDLTWLFFPD